MAKVYGRSKESLAWPSLHDFDRTIRRRGESCVDFIRRFEIAFSMAKGYDAEIAMSDRTLAMLCLNWMCISQTDRTGIITKIKTEDMNIRKLSALIGDVVTSDPFYHEPGKEDVSVEQAFLGDNEEAAVFAKRFGKQPGSEVVCHRCRKSGYLARDCLTPWEKCARIRESNGVFPSSLWL